MLTTTALEWRSTSLWACCNGTNVHLSNSQPLRARLGGRGVGDLFGGDHEPPAPSSSRAESGPRRRCLRLPEKHPLVQVSDFLLSFVLEEGGNLWTTRLPARTCPKAGAGVRIRAKLAACFYRKLKY